MAYITCKLKSETLDTRVDIQVYFPTDLPEQVGNKVNGVLTLLHGYSNAADDWMQMSAATRYAADNGLVLIAPSCQNSFYQDMAYGGAWKTFLTEEMPFSLGKIFKLPTEREKNFIAGLSMGGYGALYLGMSCPDLYAGCASFSGAVDVAMMLDAGECMPEIAESFVPVFGENLALPKSSNLHYLSEKISRLPMQQQPKIIMTNGIEDVEPFQIKAQNDSLHATMESLPLAQYKRMEWHGGHEWSFWDRSLIYAIDYFLENDYAEKKMADWTHEPIVY